MVEVTACPVCTAGVKNVVGRRGRSRIYCSRKCNDQATRDRASAKKQAARQASVGPCENCGGRITVGATGPVPKWCSARCNEIAKGRHLSSSYPSRSCELEGCDATFTPQSMKQRCCSEAHGKAHYRAKAKAEGRRWPGKPETRRANLRRKTQQRRARLKGDVDAELIDRDEIGHRDGWRCGLCSAHIDSSLQYPHPRSASLDHIEPLSLGGKHVKANVQIAHLACNVAKGNRGGGEQLLLIG